jgi:chromosome segregation ATPase
LREQVGQLKRSNGQLVQRVADLERDLATADFELDRAREVVGLFTQPEIDRAREREEAKRRQLQANLARADMEEEQQRRADRLAKKDRNASGAAATFGEHARAALEKAGGNWRKVDWRAVEGAAAIESMREHGQAPASVIEALLTRSPGRVDPSTHAEVREGIARVAPGLQAEHRAARRPRGLGL